VLEGRRELPQDGRELGELLVARAERRRTLALEALQPIFQVHGVVDAVLFPVVDHVEARRRLASYDVSDGAARGRPERRPVAAPAGLVREHDVQQVARARQAAGMGGEDLRGAPFHDLLRTASGWARRAYPTPRGFARGDDVSAVEPH
jgi:hypothetical protein